MVFGWILVLPNGRYDGLTHASIAAIAAEPSMFWIGIQPSLTIWNDQA